MCLVLFRVIVIPFSRAIHKCYSILAYFADQFIESGMEMFIVTVKMFLMT